MVRAMDSPTPMPSALLVKNGSKTSFNLSSGMPEPIGDLDAATVQLLKRAAAVQSGEVTFKGEKLPGPALASPNCAMHRPSGRSNT